MAMEFSVLALADQIRTEADAYKYVEELRWAGTPLCPHCGATDRISFLNPENGVSRKTRTGKPSERRVWFCGHCRKQFTALVGTIFHGTKVPLRKWLFVCYEMCANKNGIAAREIQRKYEVTAKTAWFMTQRIREGMKRGPFTTTLTGTIIADETWIGGKPRNKHQQGRPVRLPEGGRGRSGHASEKVTVASLIHEETGEVRSAVIRKVDSTNIRRFITEHVDIDDSVLHTDAAMAYRKLGEEFIDHQWVDHSSWEYVRGDVSTNAAEGFFSQLKRSIDGTHHKLSPEHLHRYLAEFDFRYTTRKMSDSARTKRLFGQVGGRRLTWRPLTAG